MNMYRNPVITMSRTVGMFFIVLCHIIKYYPFIPGQSMLAAFFGSGVPLFILLSGYLYGGKAIKSFRPWYARRIHTIAVPAIAMAFFTIVALLIAGETISIWSIIAYMIDMEGLLFLNWNFFGFFFSEITSLGALWFTTVIMLCYLLVPVLQRITIKNKNNKAFAFLLLSIGLVVSLIVMDYLDIMYFWMFCVGYCLGKVNALEKVNLKCFLSCSVVLLASLVGRLILHRYFDNTILYYRYAPVSRLIMGGWVIVFFAFIAHLKPVALSKIAATKLVTILDNYSYYVYLVHGVLCMGAFNVYEHLSWQPATITFFMGTAVLACGLKHLSDCITKVLEK